MGEPNARRMGQPIAIDELLNRQNPIISEIVDVRIGHALNDPMEAISWAQRDL